ncbi:MAG: hypothetical protein K0R03_2651 [Moraxellaceae bacterium]|jgi:putative membrane protein|nr:hypothetical protein [Moraxellaceae bacterium]
MKDQPFALLLLALGVALPATALTPPLSTAEAAAQPPASRTLLPQDRGFVDAFVTAGLAVIETGELAGRLADDPELRRLGSRLAADFAAANRRLAELLGPMQLAPLPDEPDAEHKAIADRLRESGAADFDHLYLELQQRDHRDLVALLEMQMGVGENAELKKFAAELLPQLRANLQRISKLAESMKAGAPPCRDCPAASP